MASITIPNPNRKPWVTFNIPRNTETAITLANGGQYLFICSGAAGQASIFHVITGNSGNVSFTKFGDSTSWSAATSTGTIAFTQSTTATRPVFVMTLNDVAPPSLS